MTLRSFIKRELSDGSRPTLFVSRPNFFGVDYVINPWMTGQVGNCDREIATKQWRDLVNILRLHANVLVMSSTDQTTPDVTFVANAGSFIPVNYDTGYKYAFVCSNFKHPERTPEEEFFIDEVQWEGFNSVIRPFSKFEGDGDLLRLKDRIVVGYGHRSDFEFINQLETITFAQKDDIIGLKLVDDRFYHLDTCFFYHSCVGREFCMYFPDAFDDESRGKIEYFTREMNIPTIRVTEKEAKTFACNAIGAGNRIIAHHLSERINQMLTSLGFVGVSTDLSEFHKAGGSAKCLTLRVPSRAIR